MVGLNTRLLDKWWHSKEAPTTYRAKKIKKTLFKLC